MPNYDSPIIQSENEYYRVVSALLEVESGALVFRTTDILNSKISGLLTHISIMMAILSFFLAQLGNFSKVELFTSLITVEITFYLFFAIGCLRGLFITNPRTFRGCEDHAESLMIMTIRQRRRIYLFCLNGTIVVTIAFLITLLEKVFLHVN